jgi:fructose-1,6-bisphosphatase/inositol monophosphatase family enzyme
MNLPATFPEAGLTPEVLREIDYLVVGVGGLVRELLTFTAGASTVKDASRQRLTVADTLADRLLRESLLRHVPGSSGYSEEEGHFGSASGGRRVRWLVDPLDGTRPATLGGAFGISVAGLVLEQDRPLGAVGWVYVPTLGVLYRGILAPGYRDCRANEVEVRAEELTASDLPTRYTAVGSDWCARRPAELPMKLSAPGATAVHLTQLVHAGSDVAAVMLSRYKPYDAAAGIVIAAAGGCDLYAVDDRMRPLVSPTEPLRFLGEGDREPDRYGPPMLVCREAVARALREG